VKDLFGIMMDSNATESGNIGCIFVDRMFSKAKADNERRLHSYDNWRKTV